MEHLYIHLPFCKQKCNYCDFISSPEFFQKKNSYLSLLAKEAAKNQHLRPIGGLKTLYFGGGTPSLLEVKELEGLLAVCEDVFGFGENIEISMECNPESVNSAYLRDICSLGVNRISFGGQAFQDRLLKAMGRLHNREDLIKAVESSYQVGFENISLDLMYGLPTQTLDEWQESLAMAVNLPVVHISNYGLKLSEDSPWGKKYFNGELEVADDELNSAMELLALDYLEKHGFPWYEVANTAKVGYRCRHNLAYWERKDYLGLGLNASSLLGEVRYRNTVNFADYEKKLQKDVFPYEEVEILTSEDIFTEEIMLPLRLRTGLNLEKIAEKYGNDFWNEKKGQMVKFFNLGYVEVENSCLKLCTKGIPLHNEVILTLI